MLETQDPDNTTKVSQASLPGPDLSENLDKIAKALESSKAVDINLLYTADKNSKLLSENKELLASIDKNIPKLTKKLNSTVKDLLQKKESTTDTNSPLTEEITKLVEALKIKNVEEDKRVKKSASENYGERERALDKKYEKNYGRGLGKYFPDLQKKLLDKRKDKELTDLIDENPEAAAEYRYNKMAKERDALSKNVKPEATVGNVATAAENIKTKDSSEVIEAALKAAPEKKTTKAKKTVDKNKPIKVELTDVNDTVLEKLEDLLNENRLKEQQQQPEKDNIFSRYFGKKDATDVISDVKNVKDTVKEVRGVAKAAKAAKEASTAAEGAGTAAGEAAAGTTGKVLTTASKFGKVAKVGGALVGGAVEGLEEYNKSGNVKKAATVGVGGTAGGWAGAEVGAIAGAEAGAAIGTIVPGIGNAIGAAAGGIIGGILGGIGGTKLGAFLGKKGYEAVEGEPGRETGQVTPETSTTKAPGQVTPETSTTKAPATKTSVAATPALRTPGTEVATNVNEYKITAPSQVTAQPTGTVTPVAQLPEVKETEEADTSADMTDLKKTLDNLNTTLNNQSGGGVISSVSNNSNGTAVYNINAGGSDDINSSRNKTDIRLTRFRALA